MKSIKPGRGPSGMSFIGSIFVVIFGIFWTFMAFSTIGGSGIIGVIFPLFGVFFVIMGILQAVYNYKNATGKDRFSTFDITDSGEEGDPSNEWIKNQFKTNATAENKKQLNGEINYCPYCGAEVDSGFSFCPKCGKNIK